MDLFNVPVTCPINRYFFPAGNKWNKTLTVSCSDSFLRCHENEEHYCIMSLPLKILLYSFNQWTLFILQGSLCWHTFPLSLLFWFVLLFLFLLLLSFLHAIVPSSTIHYSVLSLKNACLCIPQRLSLTSLFLHVICHALSSWFFSLID